MKLVEIRAAEGGADAKLLVSDMFDIYSRAAARHGFKVTLVERASGYVLFRTDADAFFLKETGGHRWQRVPPTERYGRVQTSTVTVAALDDAPQQFRFDESEMVVTYYKAPGKGGQKRNKTENACRIQYADLLVTCADERSKRQNYERALSELKRRLEERHRQGIHTKTNNARREQIGSGQRGDKIRTYRAKDDVVIDHRTGQHWCLSDILRGKWPV
jgi:peptide chain release factor 1